MIPAAGRHSIPAGRRLVAIAYFLGGLTIILFAAWMTGLLGIFLLPFGDGPSLAIVLSPPLLLFAGLGITSAAKHFLDEGDLRRRDWILSWAGVAVTAIVAAWLCVDRYPPALVMLVPVACVAFLLLRIQTTSPT